MEFFLKLLMSLFKKFKKIRIIFINLLKNEHITDKQFYYSKNNSIMFRFIIVIFKRAELIL